MSLLDKRTTADAVKLLIFILVTTVATGFLAVTIGNLSFSASKQYKAVFTDATGVVKGDDIRVAGVKVGSVEDVDVTDRTRALVTFKVEEDQKLTDSTFAAIRYRNLVGQRYIALTQGVG
jgi:phospholipid/cholesterol/gamma-HCH transport system substrate-binding protein